MKVSRFNKFSINESSCKVSSLKGEVTLYRLTSHNVVNLKETGNYYVSSKSDLDPGILSKKGKDIFMITVKCDAANIQLDESEKECAKLNSSSIVYVKDDKKCKLVSVEPYSSQTNESLIKEDIYDLFADFDYSKQKHLEQVMDIQNKAVQEGDTRFANELMNYYKKLSSISANLMNGF